MGIYSHEERWGSVDGKLLKGTSTRGGGMDYLNQPIEILTEDKPG